MRSPLSVLCLACFAAACGDRPGWIQTDIDAELPVSLGDVGVYSDLENLEFREDLVAYTPAFPLWTSGAKKQRAVYVPPGEAITPGDVWDFPVGTVLVKTFSIDRPLETRLLFRRKAGWDYAVYAWDEEGKGAEIRDGNWVAQSVAGLDYTIPGRLDCRACHEAAEEQFGTAVLGIGDLQIDDDLAGSELFDGRPDVVDVAGRTEAETDALGYFVGNCVHCHAGGYGENASFSLLPDAAVANTVDQPFEAGRGVRVAPGDPDASGLYLVVVEGGATAEDSMPPLGIDRRDPAADDILATWIEGL